MLTSRNNPPFQVYRSELEESGEFKGFKDFAQTYPLTRGKGNDDEDGKTVGQFKVRNV